MSSRIAGFLSDNSFKRFSLLLHALRNYEEICAIVKNFIYNETKILFEGVSAMHNTRPVHRISCYHTRPLRRISQTPCNLPFSHVITFMWTSREITCLRECWVMPTVPRSANNYKLGGGRVKCTQFP